MKDTSILLREMIGLKEVREEIALGGFIFWDFLVSDDSCWSAYKTFP